MIELEVKSSLDGSVEKNLFQAPEGGGERPLLVGLHTWSADRLNQVKSMLPLAQQRGWALLLPEFRGPNLVGNPRAREACASQPARQDILDAVEFVAERYPIDRGHIFLLGGSGGGHMALMMAAAAPGLWRAVSSWCPITDLAAWHGQNPGYAEHIAACCGGVPGASPEVDREYLERSPLHRAPQIAEACVFVHHGRFDRSVPYSHTYRLVEEIERLGGDRFFFEVFNGGHDIHCDAALSWFDAFLAADSGETALSG